MSTRDVTRGQIFSDLSAFEGRHGALPGIQSAAQRNVFVEQLVDSVRRVEFVRVLGQRDISAARCNPHGPSFDPIRAGLSRRNAGELDEACWLILLSVHCGKHRADGWALARQLYAGNGPNGEWTWNSVSHDVQGFRQWLIRQNRRWEQSQSAPRFGNHRKYESRAGDRNNGTGAVAESYVDWVLAAGDHQTLITNARHDAGLDEAGAFDILYSTMSCVRRFGRLARFDYLCMLEKCGLAEIAPGHPYLDQATGPVKGAALLFGSGVLQLLNSFSAQLAISLNVNMQVMEDALCNWAKSPGTYTRFSG